MPNIDYALEESVRLLQQEMAKLDMATKDYASSPTPANQSWLHLHIQNVQALRLQVAQLNRIISYRIQEHDK